MLQNVVSQCNCDKSFKHMPWQLLQDFRNIYNLHPT